MVQPWDFMKAPVYTFLASKTENFDSKQALQLTQTLLSLGRVAFQIVAAPDGIRWQALDLSLRAVPVSIAVSGTAEVQTAPLSDTIGDILEPERFPYHRNVTGYLPSRAPRNPLLYVTDFKGESDPLIPLARGMSYLNAGEHVRFIIIVNRQVSSAGHEGVVRTVKALSALFSEPTPRYYQREEEKIVTHKLQQPWYECMLLLEADSPDPQRTFTLLQSLDPTFQGFDRVFQNHPHNGLRNEAPISPSCVWQIEDLTHAASSMALFGYEDSLIDSTVAKEFKSAYTYLEASELAALWHLPHSGFKQVNVIWRKQRPEPARVLIQNTQGIVLGDGFFNGQRVPIRILDADRAAHLNIVGKTNVGKSTLMHHLIHQDIAAGKGLAVIDPHGQLVRNLLRRSIPPKRENDVIVLDLNRPENPIPLNLFGGAQTYGAIGRVVDIIENMYTQTGVRMDRFLRAAIQTMRYVPNATMKDVYLFLVNGEFRAKVMENIQEEDLYQMWEREYHLLPLSQQRMIRDPILNRIEPFYANEYLYPSLCHPERLNLPLLIEQQKIVLVSLGVNGEIVPKKERDLIGSMLISLFQMVGMNPNRDPIPFYVYIDELQNFVTTSIEVVFSEARKYGLHMTVANQYLGQLSGETHQAIMGNVGTTISYRIDAPDARTLAAYMKPQFEPTDLVNLDKYQAAVKMQFNGLTQDAFLLQALDAPAEPQDADGRETRIRALSMKNYTPMSRSEVESWLNTRYPKIRRVVPPAPSSSDEAPPDDQNTYYDERS